MAITSYCEESLPVFLFAKNEPGKIFKPLQFSYERDSHKFSKVRGKYLPVNSWVYHGGFLLLNTVLTPTLFNWLGSFLSLMHWVKFKIKLAKILAIS